MLKLSSFSLLLVLLFLHLLCVLYIGAGFVNAVDHSKFRKCSDTGFCKYYRNNASKNKAIVLKNSITIHHPSELSSSGSAGSSSSSSSQSDSEQGGVSSSTSRILSEQTIAGTKGTYVSMKVSMDSRYDVPLIAKIYCLKTGSIRFIVDQDQQFNSKKRYTDFWKDVLLSGGEFEYDQIEYIGYSSINGEHQLQCHKDNVINLKSDPFKLDLVKEGRIVLSLNENNMMYFEQAISDGNLSASKQNQEHTNDGSSSSSNVNADGETKKDEDIVDWGEDGKPIYSKPPKNAEENAEADQNQQASQGESTKEPTENDRAKPESFGGHTDPKPNGPMSVGFDLLFPYAKHVYGLPEHTSPLSLKNTDGSRNAYSEPYRIYNLDVFEYELDSPAALYGGVPILIAASTFSSSSEQAHFAGVYYNNPSELFVDIADKNNGKTTRWMSESGLIDLFILPGPKIENVISQYTKLTGTQELPPMFAIGYHQCRWNYKDEKDVEEVEAKFEEYDFPVDVIWLDIEHTDGKRYFTWDDTKFPDPVKMQNKLWEHKRRMVTIVDPHVKRDNNYRIHKIATEKGYYVKDSNGKSDFEGWCWPGSSSYLDFTSKEVRSWWSDQFSFDAYTGSTPHLYIWNDMNEPSVFNGPEVSMKKDALSLSGVEHREWHNLYGFYNQMGTAEGLVRRHSNSGLPATSYPRPFVLSRSFFAGSPRHGAIWTGDNAAKWEHLKMSSPMLLSIGLGGQAFIGADVGGFFGDPDPELLLRWYQAAAFQPFFRAHAHIETKRREPWMFGPEVLANIRSAVIARYSFLPFIYSLFYEAYKTGMPVMRPIWMHYPSEQAAFAMDDEWLLGKDLLIYPITAPGVTYSYVNFPGSKSGELWYDVITYDEISSFKGLFSMSSISVNAPLDKIPVFQRGGSIIPRKMRLRRSSEVMRNDPFTLIVALDLKREAYGSLYVDDELTLEFKNNNYLAADFKFADGKFYSNVERATPSSDFRVGNTIERIIIAGWKRAGSNSLKTVPTEFTAKQNEKSWTVEGVYDESNDTLTLRKPLLRVSESFTIEIKA